MKLNHSTLTNEMERCYGGTWISSEVTMGYLLGVCRQDKSYKGLAFIVGGGEFPLGTKPFADPEGAMNQIRQMALEWHAENVSAAWAEMLKQNSENN